MVERPTKPFRDAVHDRPTRPKRLTQDDLLALNPERHRDNVEMRLEPKQHRNDHPALAPPGMSGTRRNLPTPAREKAERKVVIEGPGDLARTFKPIARGIDKDRGPER